MKLPQLFVEKMQNMLQDEFPLYMESFNQNRLYGLRANTLKISPGELREKLRSLDKDYDPEPVPWCSEGYYYPENIRPAKHPYYSAGLYYIQEPSAMSTGAMLPIEPGDRVLDLCAAPGGKSTQAAAKLRGEGIIVSNDISTSRCKALLKNIEVSGVRNAVITNETPERLAKRFEGFFNKIIVDAPCSGEGMFRKDDAAAKSWESHKTEYCCTLQRDILKNAARMLSGGGIIAYSTCTFAPEEDEGMIWEFLKEHTEFELMEVDKTKGFDRGRPEWTSDGGEELTKCGRLWPYKVKGEGHFLCLMKKKDGDSSVRLPVIKSPSVRELADYFEFSEKYLNIEIKDNLTLHGSSLMAVPMGLELKGLRVMRSGLYLGEMKTKRFEPAQALAMALKKNEARLTLDLAPDSDLLKRYMRGESINIEKENSGIQSAPADGIRLTPADGIRLAPADGWILICVDGYPLGWGKAQKGRLKNKYLPSWMTEL